MQTCSNCSAENKEGEIICYRCGQLLSQGPVQEQSDTRILRNETKNLAFPSRMWGTSRLDSKSLVIFRIKGIAEPLQVYLDDEVTMGRSSSSAEVDVDLNPYGASEKGVSRRHAKLKRQNDTVTVTDLGSSNHTFINGQRIVPEEIRILRDGDELRLGRLIMNVNFGEQN